MKSPAGVLRLLLSAAGALFAGVLPAGAAAPPVMLSAANAASSVWDTDSSKVGIELQVVNGGTVAAEDVRVTAVDVQGGVLAAAYSSLPIALGNIAPQGSALLDLVITVPRADGTAAYLLTINGSYRTSGAPQPFSLTRTVAPGTAAPVPIPAKSGASATAPNPPASPAGPPAAGGPPGLAPNATTPMLIPPGPPRGPSLTNPDEAGPATQQRR
jgi:hypothetical protein